MELAAHREDVLVIILDPEWEMHIWVIAIYDSLFEIGRCLTEIYSSLKFCQTVILCDFLSDTDEFLSYFIEFLSNTGCYLDSLLFCQCP